MLSNVPSTFNFFIRVIIGNGVVQFEFQHCFHFTPVNVSNDTSGYFKHKYNNQKNCELQKNYEIIFSSIRIEAVSQREKVNVFPQKKKKPIRLKII